MAPSDREEALLREEVRMTNLANGDLRRQVAAVREALASIEYNARSALAALDRGSFNREDASLRADYEWFATTAGAALDTASAGGRNTDPPARPSLDDGQEDRGDSQGAVRDG